MKEMISKNLVETELAKQSIDVKRAEVQALETEWRGRLEMTRIHQESLSLRENKIAHSNAQLDFQKQTISSINQSNMAPILICRTSRG